MEHKKICVTSQYSVGCTFIDWSIQFLSGQSKFYHADSNTWIDLVSNPLTGSNAHTHRKNHPHGFRKTNDLLNAFDQQSAGVFTGYPNLIKFYAAAEELGIAVDKNTADPVAIEKISNYRQQDYVNLFKLCAERDTKIIYINASPEIVLYHTNFRRGGNFLLTNEFTNSQEELTTEYEEYFFKDSINAYKDSTNVWDVRERRALNVRPFEHHCAVPNFKLPHLWLDSRSVWTVGEETMQKILDYVDLPLISERLDAWLPIYRTWQKIQFKNLDFCHVLPHIVEAIVNGWDYQFEDLTFEQEVVIQHCLMYQHDLNLKTWQLTKFPKNTKDLHALLETNIHQLASIYLDLNLRSMSFAKAQT
jgi:hypothetical protein